MCSKVHSISFIEAFLVQQHSAEHSRVRLLLRWGESIAFGLLLMLPASFMTRMHSEGERLKFLAMYIEGPERFIQEMKDAPDATFYVGLPLPFFTEKGKLFITKERYRGFWSNPHKGPGDRRFSPIALSLDILFFSVISHLYHSWKRRLSRNRSCVENPSMKSSSPATSSPTP